MISSRCWGVISLTFRRHAGIDRIGFESGARKDEGPGGDDAARSDDGVVENRCTHADQAVVLDRCAVNGGVVADRDIVSDMGLRGMGRTVVKGMDDRPVLNIGSVTDGNRIDVAAQHGIEPHGAVTADGHVTDQYGRIGNESSLSHLGHMAPHLFYICHRNKL